MIIKKLLGDINWIKPYLKLTTAELKPLFNILHEDPDPTSKRQLTAKAPREALGKCRNSLLSNSYVKRIDFMVTWQFLSLATPTAPYGSPVAKRSSRVDPSSRPSWKKSWLSIPA